MGVENAPVNYFGVLFFYQISVSRKFQFFGLSRSVCLGLLTVTPPRRRVLSGGLRRAPCLH